MSCQEEFWLKGDLGRDNHISGIPGGIIWKSLPPKNSDTLEKIFAIGDDFCDHACEPQFDARIGGPAITLGIYSHSTADAEGAAALVAGSLLGTSNNRRC
jgi:hypothetical protein